MLFRSYAGVVTRLNDRTVHLIGGVFYCGMWRRRLDEAEMFATGNYVRDYRSCPDRSARGPAHYRSWSPAIRR